MTTNIKQVDYHRNGVSGRGFFVAIVEDPFNTGDHPGDFLVVTFPTEEDERKSDHTLTAVFNLEMLASGDIGFGKNSWRGDKASYACGDQIIDKWHVDSDARFDALMAEAKARKETPAP